MCRYFRLGQSMNKSEFSQSSSREKISDFVSHCLPKYIKPRLLTKESKERNFCKLAMAFYKSATLLNLSDG